MASERISRRGFLVRGGTVVGAATLAHALPDAVLGRLGGSLWLPQAAASGGCFEPFPDPIALGWTKEGDEGFTPGWPLIISDMRKIGDPNRPLPFCTFHCDASSLVGSGITLHPSAVLSGVSTDADGNTGVHVTINDGILQIRAAVFQVGALFEVRLETGSPGWTRGLALQGQWAVFTLRRDVDGSGMLTVDTDTVTLTTIEQPPSTRPGLKTIEFGTYNVPATATLSWDRLGLPQRTLAVTIDIKPGADPNSVSLSDSGLLPVAILGSAGFDVGTVNPETLELGGVDIALRGSAKAPKFAYSYEDVNGDGYLDLVAFFEVPVLVEAGALTESTLLLNLTGALADGRPIQGADSIRVVS